MSSPNYINPDPPQEPDPYLSRQWIFDHIPLLKELLPQREGVPGVTYFQCATENLRQAQDLGFGEVISGSVYTIVGPLGSVNMKLYGYGRPIPGLAPQSSKRRVFIDKLVGARTGWDPKNPGELLPGVEVPEGGIEIVEPEPEPELPQAAMAPVPEPEEDPCMAENEKGLQCVSALRHRGPHKYREA